MKITEKKLRQIIREEKMKLQGARLHEAEDVDFYSEKVNLLTTAQDHFLAALRAMQPSESTVKRELDLAKFALAEAFGLDEDPDVQSAYNDVEDLALELKSTLEAMGQSLGGYRKTNQFIDGVVRTAIVTQQRRTGRG